MDNAEGSSGSVTKLSEIQEAVLVGTLLGDGCLAKHGRYHRLHVKHALAHRSLAEFKHRVFGNFVSMPLHCFEQRLNGRGFPCFQFASRTNPVFTLWHDRFYETGRKCVPADVGDALSPLALAVWLMDDGSADYAGVTFQTHCFSHEEVCHLGTVLEESFGLAISLRKNRGSWIIYVKAQSVERLRSAVDEHLLPQFVYKVVPRRTRTP